MAVRVSGIMSTQQLFALIGVVVALFFAGDSQATGQVALARWLFETAKELPRSHAPDETPEAELVRLELISRGYARAVVPYADGKGWTGSELAMALLILIDEETRLDERIHAGTGHPVWNEDHGRAKCLGQVHSSNLVPVDEWKVLQGIDEDATLRCAAATALVWVSVAKQCGVWLGQRANRNRVAATFMAYGSGGTCSPDERAWSRADKWLARMAKRPDRSPVKGFRRVMPSEVTPGAQQVATRLRDEIGNGVVTVGFLEETAVDEHRWAFRIENHADGKTGVSVFLKEE